MFVAALEELAGQLASLSDAARPRSATPAPPLSPMMQRVRAAAPSAALDAYLEGRGPQAPARRDLAQLVDDNLRLLRVLAAEVGQLLAAMQVAYEAARGASAATGAGQGAERGGLAERELCMAAVLDGLEQEAALLTRVAEAAVLDTPPDELESYATILGTQPFLDLKGAAVAECLSWQRADEGQADTLQSEQELQPRKRATGAAPARTRVVCEGLAPLLEHAKAVAAGVLEAATSSAYDPVPDADRLAQLCFALRSTMGALGRFSTEDEVVIWELSQRLWEASWEWCEGQDPDAAKVGDALSAMASGLFQLLESDCEESDSPFAYVSFFCQAARTWARLGRRPQAAECLRTAMRYSECLEALVDDASLAPAQRERATVQLFELFLAAARSAQQEGGGARQPAAAFNLLSRAVALSRHSAVGPDAGASMVVAIAELQLEQARGMLGRGDVLLAASLLSGALQQANAVDLPLAAVSRQHLEGLQECKRQVLLLLCKAHLAAGDARQAHKVLEALEKEGGRGGSEAGAESLQLAVRVKVAAGRLIEALQLLTEALRAADAAAPEGQPTLRRWLELLRVALPHAGPTSLHAFQAAVTAFVWKAVGCPVLLQQLVQTLLAEAEVALEALAHDDVVASLFGDRSARMACHGALWHRGSACLQGGEPAAAAQLLAAAFQLAGPELRAKNARMLAACHAAAGEHRRAVEYLDMAARHEQRPSCFTQLRRLASLAALGEEVQAMAVVQGLETCADFDPSMVSAVMEAVAQAPSARALAREALAMAVRTLVRASGSASALPAGQEAGLLLAYVRAIVACLDGAASNDGKEAESLCGELTRATKLANSRLAELGAQRFAGSGGGGPATLRHIADAAAGGMARALAAGLLNQGAALAMALYALMSQAGAALGGCSLEEQGALLMQAAQALLGLAGQAADAAARGHKLELAGKLLTKLLQHLHAMPADQAVSSWPLHHLLSLGVAAHRADAAAALRCLAALQQSARARALAPRQLRCILDAAGSLRGAGEVHAAAVDLVVDGVLADGSPAALSLLPELLHSLRLSPSKQLAFYDRCAGQPSLFHTAAEGRRVGQWLVCAAWNAGVKAAGSAQQELGAALMGAAVSLLKGSSQQSSSGDGQLERMEAALAALRALRAREEADVTDVRAASPAPLGAPQRVEAEAEQQRPAPAGGGQPAEHGMEERAVGTDSQTSPAAEEEPEAAGARQQQGAGQAVPISGAQQNGGIDSGRDEAMEEAEEAEEAMEEEDVGASMQEAVADKLAMTGGSQSLREARLTSPPPDSQASPGITGPAAVAEVGAGAAGSHGAGAQASAPAPAALPARASQEGPPSQDTRGTGAALGDDLSEEEGAAATGESWLAMVFAAGQRVQGGGSAWKPPARAAAPAAARRAGGGSAGGMPRPSPPTALLP
eukprot:scaffold3.g6319.t1